MIKYRQFNKNDIPELILLTDTLIGTGYYSADELLEIYNKGQYKNTQLSIIVENHSKIIGFRFTLAPKKWIANKKTKQELWPKHIDKDKIAYFQSIFISKDMMGQGIGIQASLESIKLLKQLGIKGIVCHSHVESPYNSSQKYLLKLGFTNLFEYPNFWADIDYICDTCKVNPCKCTAREMFLEIT